jgi:threonine dehydratase
MLALSEIYSARENILDFIHRTPMVTLRSINELCKLDTGFGQSVFKNTGSFKSPSASNKMKSSSSLLAEHPTRHHQ